MVDLGWGLGLGGLGAGEDALRVFGTGGIVSGGVRGGRMADGIDTLTSGGKGRGWEGA